MRSLHLQVAAQGGCTLEVTQLDPNKEYLFAVAAYTHSGEMVGGAIGHTGPPVVTCYQLPLISAWVYCCQVGSAWVGICTEVSGLGGEGGSVQV